MMRWMILFQPVIRFHRRPLPSRRQSLTIRDEAICAYSTVFTRQELLMIRNTVIRISVAGAAALMLAACGSPRYQSSVPGDTDPIAATQAPPVAYRGSQGGMVVVNSSDVAINGQVISAV